MTLLTDNSATYDFADSEVVHGEDPDEYRRDSRPRASPDDVSGIRPFMDG